MKKLIQFDPNQMAGITARMSLIQQKEFELACLRDGLIHFIETQTGVDLNKQNWELDLDHAQMTRTPAARKQNSGSDN